MKGRHIQDMATCSLSTNMYEEDANIHESKNAENAGQKIAVTHLLLVKGKGATCETAFHKTCNVTHKLLVTGKDAMKLPFTKSTMLLTSCWS
jgi:hypothetical protein